MIVSPTMVRLVGYALGAFLGSVLAEYLILRLTESDTGPDTGNNGASVVTDEPVSDS